MLVAGPADGEFGGFLKGDVVDGDNGTSAAITVKFPAGTIAKWKTAGSVKTKVHQEYNDIDQNEKDSVLNCSFR